MVDAPSGAAATGDGFDPATVGVAEPAAPDRRVTRRLVRGLSALSVLVLLYVTFTFWQVWRASRTDDPRVSDAIVVLGAAQYDGRPSPVLQARLDTALDLYRRGVAPLIVTTGANQAGDRFTEADSGVTYLRERGVPAAALRAVPVGTNTWQELDATAQVLEPLGRSSVVLVSDPYHAYRVDHVADEVGLDAVVVSTPGAAPLGRLVRETAGASVSRFVGYEALTGLG
jgi:vancomycin permeability regulator SanA